MKKTSNMKNNTVKVSVDVVKDSGERASLKDILANEEQTKVILGISQNSRTLREIVYGQRQLERQYNEMLKFYNEEDLNVLIELVGKQMASEETAGCCVPW